MYEIRCTRYAERAHQNSSQPIPVVFNLSSWSEKQTLSDWLVAELKDFYKVPKKTGQAWVESDQMLLLLDGLDEVKKESRAACVEALNHFRDKHGLTSLVVCSRSEEYFAIDTPLEFEGAITIQLLSDKQIEAYFERFGKSLTHVNVDPKWPSDPR